MTRIAIDGLYLNVEVAGGGEPLVLLHGFTGSTAAWEPHIAVFRRHFRTLAIDLLGHGLSDSPQAVERYRMDRFVLDLTALIDKLGIAAAHWLGYSLGGRTALCFAVAYPGRVLSLVLEGTSAGIADPAERAARAAADEALAVFIEGQGMEAFVERWSRLPIFASQERLAPQVRQQLYQQRLHNDPVGLANSLRGMGAGAQRPMQEALASMNMPTLLVVGAEDPKYRDIAADMAQRLPRAKVTMIEGAGHAAHLENPVGFDQAVLDFLLAQRMSPAAPASN